MPVPITALYASLLTFVLIALGALVGAGRARTGVSILHGGDMDLATRIRRHANFIENVPMALLLLAVIELNGASAAWLHVLGVVLLLSRIAHPLGLDPEEMNRPLRSVGAGGTYLVMLGAAVTALWQAVAG